MPSSSLWISSYFCPTAPSIPAAGMAFVLRAQSSRCSKLHYGSSLWLMITHTFGLFPPLDLSVIPLGLSISVPPGCTAEWQLVWSGSHSLHVFSPRVYLSTTALLCWEMVMMMQVPHLCWSFSSISCSLWVGFRETRWPNFNLFWTEVLLPWQWIWNSFLGWSEMELLPMVEQIWTL